MAEQGQAGIGGWERKTDLWSFRLGMTSTPIINGDDSSGGLWRLHQGLVHACSKPLELLS
jgi:hypothetical protein